MSVLQHVIFVITKQYSRLFGELNHSWLHFWVFELCDQEAFTESEMCEKSEKSTEEIPKRIWTGKKERNITREGKRKELETKTKMLKLAEHIWAQMEKYRDKIKKETKTEIYRTI